MQDFNLNVVNHEIHRPKLYHTEWGDIQAILLMKLQLYES